MNSLKSLQERVVQLSGLPKDLAAVDRAAVHLTGFGKVEGLVSWKSHRKQYALATFATTEGSMKALRASSIKTMYGKLGILEPLPNMWKFLDPSSSGSIRHIPLTATSPGKAAQCDSVQINTASIVVAIEKRMKDIEVELGDSRENWTASLKAVNGDVKHLKELYRGLLGGSDTNKCYTTSSDTPCGGPRVSPDTNDHLIRLLSIVIEELKKRETN